MLSLYQLTGHFCYSNLLLSSFFQLIMLLDVAQAVLDLIKIESLANVVVSEILNLAVHYDF